MVSNGGRVTQLEHISITFKMENVEFCWRKFFHFSLIFPSVDIFSGCASILETVCMRVNINKSNHVSFGMVRSAGSGSSDLVRHRHDAFHFTVIYIILRWRVERTWKRITRVGDMYTDGFQITRTWKIEATLFPKCTDSDQEKVNCL